MSGITKKKRPLSPHLQVYKPQMTSMTSIFHRLTGVALFTGCFFVAWWLFAIANSGSHFFTFHDFATSICGQILLLGWSFSLIYHLLNCMRHLM